MALRCWKRLPSQTAISSPVAAHKLPSELAASPQKLVPAIPGFAIWFSLSPSSRNMRPLAEAQRIVPSPPAANHRPASSSGRGMVFQASTPFVPREPHSKFPVSSAKKTLSPRRPTKRFTRKPGSAGTSWRKIPCRQETSPPSSSAIHKVPRGSVKRWRMTASASSGVLRGSKV